MVSTGWICAETRRYLSGSSIVTICIFYLMGVIWGVLLFPSFIAKVE
jgi:hypothetical protein